MQPPFPTPAPNAQTLELQRRVAESEERLRMAVEAGQVGIWDWDIVTGQVTWSPRVYEMHDMAVGSDIGGLAGFRSRIHPEDLARIEAALGAALEGTADYDVEFRTVLPSGRECWIATQGQIVRDAQGRPLRMVGASTDVTERVQLLAAERRARGEAEAARRRLELLARAGTALSGSLDPQATLQTIAELIVPGIADWCRIDLLDDEGVLRRRLAHHKDPARAQAALEMALRLRAAPGAVGSMGWVIGTGRSHFGNYVAQAVDDPQLKQYTEAFGLAAYFIIPLVARGRIIGAMAVIQAESGRPLGEDDRSLVQELGQRAALALDNARLYAAAEADRLRAESANQAKDEFLAMLGHELRNPLAPIVTALELMSRRADAASEGERRIIGRQVAHLSRLIDDLLDISRITQGKIELRREAVDLAAVVAHALELTEPVFERHAHPVALSLPPAPVWVAGDAVRLAQVLSNLLTNAAKFTPVQGKVLLALAARGGEAELVVEDTGIGIGPELLPRVFEQFVQGRQSIDRQAGGLGLGLAIVRNLVELHGGTVTAVSEGEGRGSRFTVRLPLAEGPAPLPPRPQASRQPEAAPAAGGGRILVVDDNTDAADSLADLLQVVGYETRTAPHGEAALALLDSYVPQLALLDIGLPGIDGYQLAGLLRADPRMAGARLVALTGYGRDNDRERALAARFDEHLVKPVSAERLLEVLARLLPLAG